MLRQQVKPSARIHGIVTNGGAAANIIPESAACLFYVRAAELDYMWTLHKRVIACAEGAAKATGATLKVIDYGESAYEPLKRNDTLLQAFRANLHAVGETESPEVKDRLGSSDVGNVSQVVPCIQPLMKIAPDGTPIHSRAFEAAAATPLARAGTLTAAKVMARTAYDLLADPGLVAKAKQELKGGRG
jgi:metal-dependent amidase/aminoacylase/carboxypeptidase family protein